MRVVAYINYLNIHVSYYIKQGAVVIINNWNAKNACKVSISCLLSPCCLINTVQRSKLTGPPPPKKKKLDTEFTYESYHPKNV